MRILILHYNTNTKKRATIDEHLYSFQNYSDEEIIYLNVVFGVPWYISKIYWDLVIYHYSFLSLKFSSPKKLLNRFNNLKKVNAFKIAIPQDEYINSEYLCQFIREHKIKTIFTIVSEDEWQKVYPKSKTGLEFYFKVLPGYIDDNTKNKLITFQKPHKDREIDISYRARKNPPHLGKFGMLKWMVSEKILEASKGLNLNIDISHDEEKVLYGDDWYSFLANSRVVLGSEGGSSIHDTKGKIRQKVINYLKENPDAQFDEIEENCYPDSDVSLKLFNTTPRFFQSCLTKTCQALIEGKYNGIIEPNIHYIEIKKDWSNIEEVLKKIQNISLCEQIANSAYNHIVNSNKHTYKEFVKKIFNHAKNNIEQNKIKDSSSIIFYIFLLKTRIKTPYLFNPFKYLFIEIKKILIKWHLNKLTIYLLFKNCIKNAKSY